MTGWMRNYVIQQGVYSGYTIGCRRCKGITYLPFDLMVTGSAQQYMDDHDLWCPQVLDEAIKALH